MCTMVAFKGTKCPDLQESDQVLCWVMQGLGAVEFKKLLGDGTHESCF